jgi:hypothetical protein
MIDQAIGYKIEGVASFANMHGKIYVLTIDIKSLRGKPTCAITSHGTMKLTKVHQSSCLRLYETTPAATYLGSLYRAVTVAAAISDSPSPGNQVNQSNDLALPVICRTGELSAIRHRHT